MDEKKMVNVDVLNYIYGYTQIAVLGSLGVNMTLNMSREWLENNAIEYSIPKCSSEEHDERMKENVENAVLGFVLNAFPDFDIDQIQFKGEVDMDKHSLNMDAVLTALGKLPESVLEVATDLVGIDVKTEE